MSEDTHSHSRPLKFSARQWEKQNADAFLAWRRESGVALDRMETFAAAVAEVAVSSDTCPIDEVLRALPSVMRCCDHMKFNSEVEARAYAALHLLDRYGRVTQVLEHVWRSERLPLARTQMNVLEVGAGPAPGLFACHDFYADLSKWANARRVSVEPLRGFHALDAGRAWDRFLHHLSETLILRRHHAASAESFSSDGAVAFGRSHTELTGFNVTQLHHESIASKARQIEDEFDRVEEFVSPSFARQLAYEEGGAHPSAYQLILVPNFLTQSSMLEQFRTELYGLARSLTPGGLLVFMGGTGVQYQEIWQEVHEMAKRAGLRDTSPSDTLPANSDPERLTLIAAHVRGNVQTLLAEAPESLGKEICGALPRDLWSPDAVFKLPRFRALVFANERTRRRARK